MTQLKYIEADITEQFSDCQLTRAGLAHRQWTLGVAELEFAVDVSDLEGVTVYRQDPRSHCEIYQGRSWPEAKTLIWDNFLDHWI
jgi:hypothetical protein